MRCRISSVIIITLSVAFLFAACRSGKEAEEEKKTVDSGMPQGYIGPGVVELEPLGVRFELPVELHGKVKEGQWLANTQHGTFRVAVARFDTPDKERDPKTMVAHRIEQLMHEKIEPDPVFGDLLIKMQAKEGYHARLTVQEKIKGGAVLKERLYEIIAFEFNDEEVLLISADAFKETFPEANAMLDRILATLSALETPGTAAEES